MCGNVRKYFNELTVQEKKAMISEMEQILESLEADEEKDVEWRHDEWQMVEMQYLSNSIR